MKYQLRVINGGREVQTLHLDSDSVAGATAQAEARGLRVVSVKTARRQSPRLAFAAARPVKFDAALFAQELAALLEAGVGVIDALRTMRGNAARAGAGLVYQTLLRQLDEGQALSAALEQAGNLFPAVLVACVKASEQTGDLATSLRRFSHNQASLQQLRARVAAAAIYPSVLLVTGAAVVFFLLAFVVPRFASLLEQTGRDLPLLSQWLMAWGRMVHAHGTGLAAGAGALLLTAVLVLRRPAARQRILDRILALPGIGAHVRIYRQAQFFRTAAMLVDGGIPAIQAFELAGGLVSRSDAGPLRAALQMIRNGGRISDAFEQQGLAGPITWRLLTVAEKSGRLGPVLDKVAGFQEAQVARTIELVSRLVEPCMMIAIGVVIGGIIVLMYMPIFELASSLQ